MSSNKVYLSSVALRKVSEVVSKFNLSNFELVQENTNSGIGSVIYIEFEHDYEGYDAMTRIPILDERDW